MTNSASSIKVHLSSFHLVLNHGLAHGHIEAENVVNTNKSHFAMLQCVCVVFLFKGSISLGQTIFKYASSG